MVILYGINPELNFYCLKCKNKDVVIEEKEKYYGIFKCRSDGFANEIKN